MRLGIPAEKWLNYLQTEETLIRCCRMQHLIRVCTVCHLPFQGPQDYNGLQVYNILDFIALDKKGYLVITSYFSMKNICCGFSQKHLTEEALLMSTHNICFCGEISSP